MKTLAIGTKVRVKPHTQYREVQPGYSTINPPQQIRHNGYKAVIIADIEDVSVQQDSSEIAYVVKTPSGNFDTIAPEHVVVL